MSWRKRIGWLAVLLFLIWSPLAVPSYARAFSVDVAATGTAASERAEKLQRLETAAERLYNNMQQGNAQGALLEMESLIDALEGLSFKGLTSVEGIHALAETIMDARETLSRVEVSQEEWIGTSARLRLAVNSLNHQEGALWLQYYKVMADNLQSMEKARVAGDASELKDVFQTFKEHYEVIRSAAIITRDPSEINKFESWLSYVERLSNDKTLDLGAIDQGIDLGKSLLKELFGRRADEPVFLPITGYGSPWYWSTLIGGWIVLTLFYTGFRKYRGDQIVSSVGRREDDSNHYRL
ncbi:MULTISPECIES: sporulation protein YpjB [Paenibacillus]|nr:sporulation protein YpjB [Paenibacillus anaericanus]